MRCLVPGVVWTSSFLFAIISSQSLPYTPTVILLPENSSSNPDLAYVFHQANSGSKPQLVSLNISSTISTTNISLKTLTSNLPFLQDESAAFSPSISAAGDISVYTGSCSTTASQLWRFTPSNTSAIGNGTWKQQTTHSGRDLASSTAPGAAYLSRAFSFSTLARGNDSDTSIYVFGGMCPQSNSTTPTWQSAATYSNRMRRIAPSSANEYTIGLPTSRGPPIAEAGFTITGLTPTYSNGSGVLTQQQNFVLVGGHTQTAFINTSQVAIWSLPQESWSFVAIDAPGTSNGNTELAIKSTVMSIDSRSGHTAVLSADGSKLIVYGGWVGDVNQAAEPQLVILKLGTGFGGDGDWQWVVPKNQPTTASIYGHGAAMLPGNIMLVLGGHQISSGNSKRQSGSPQASLFNATSMTWIQDYTNPSYAAALAAHKSKESSSSNTSKKVGLGAGIGLGAAAIIGAIIVFCCYNRRLKKRRELREKDLNALSHAVSNHYSPTREVSQRSGGFPWANGGWNNRQWGSDEPVFDSNSAVEGYENLQSGGIHGLGYQGAYPQPPKQIPRKPLHSRTARGTYMPTGTYDFNPVASHGRANSLGTAGPIHPIYEADEEETRKSNEGMGITVPLETKRHSDPFRDPNPNQPPAARMLNRTVSVAETDTSARSREREIREWVSDWAAAEALMTSQHRSHSNAGRISPTRRAQLIAASTVSSMSGEEDSGRTASNLSERSITVSAMSISRSGSSSQGRSRSNSLRGFISTAMGPFSTGPVTSTAPSTSITTAFMPPAPKSSDSTTSSFTTAHTSFTALQAEGETLLPRPDDFNNDQNSPTRSTYHETILPPSPSKTKAANSGLGKGRGTSSWLGSIKKAFKGEPEYDQPDFQSVPSRDTSPIRLDGPEVPRRTGSAGAALWRRKQGRSDWDDSALDSPTHNNNGRSSTFTDRSMGQYDDDDEDWDIEQAVQNRVVQVMFTVPKEKLRVVNHDVHDDLSEVGSLKSRQGSSKSITLVETVLEGAGEVRRKGKGKALEEEPVEVAVVVVERKTQDDLLPIPVVGDRKGKGKEVLGDADQESLRSAVSGRSGKSKVLDMVHDMERRHSPERALH